MRTNADVFATVLSEATGRPRNEVDKLLELFRRKFPGKGEFDAEISEEGYQSLLAQLRAEKACILKWCQEGAELALEAKRAR